MTEQEARQVILLQSHEDGGLAWNHPRADARPPLWSADDRAWATHQALAALGPARTQDAATPERFVVARAAIALQRLLPRTPAAGRWLTHGWWHPAWLWLAVLLGGVTGLAADQLGPPARVALLAPSVWLVVVWNLVVYLCLPLPWSAVRRWALRRVAAREQRRSTSGSATLWVRLAAPLSLARVSCVLHAAAASLALGVIASLYVRGLVLDYRIGWESTFLTATQMQQLLGVLLSPALWLSGQGLPDLAPLRLGPGEAASASAAPWIHLFALTLLVLVVLPRLLLALAAGARARAWRLHFPLDLATPYFQGLHPVMRPGQDHRLRLLCVAMPGVRVPPLLGRPWSGLQPWPLAVAGAPPGQAWLTSDDGETLWLYGLPAGWRADGRAAPPAATTGPARPWFSLRRLGLGPSVDPVHQALRQGADAVLLLGPPGTTASQALLALGRPVLVLEDSHQPESPALPLRALAEDGVPDWRWLTALDQRLGGDPRLHSLLATWRRRHEALQAAVAQVLAEALAGWACQREPMADAARFRLGQDNAAAEAAQARLAQGFEQAWPTLARRLSALPEAQGLPPPVRPDAPDDGSASAPAQADGAAATDTPTADAAMPASSTALSTAPSPRPVAHHRVKLRTGALVGGVLSGALTGLTADLMAGGLTLGLGTLVGAAAGALGGAGAAKGANVVRGTDQSVVAWPDDALDRFAHAAVLQALLSAWGLRPGAAPAESAPPGAALQAVWAQRSPRTPTPGDEARLAAALQPVLLPWLRTALQHAQSADAG